MSKTLIHFLAFSLVFLFAGTASAKDDKSGHGAPAGKGGEYRSDSAAKNSNSQQSEDATRGQERAAERRNEHADGAGKQSSKSMDKSHPGPGHKARNGDSDRDSDSASGSRSDRREGRKPEREERHDERGAGSDASGGQPSDDRGIHVGGLPKAHTQGGVGAPVERADAERAADAPRPGFFGRFADFFRGNEK